MPVLLFLIDTSASMNQRTHLGTTYLDIAKGAVETFMKLRSRDPASRGDRYMLVSFEDVPYGIKAGWKENHATFMTELKNLQAVGLTTVGQSLRTAFDLLNLNRLVSGIDNYGQGRNPFFLEPSIIITITDGNKLTSSSGVQDELHLPLTTPLPGSELTKEPFRWDQRLFALVLRIPGSATPGPEPVGGVLPDHSPITPMCEVTGGRSYSVLSQRMLNQCLESLVQKIQSGVVINFEKTGPDPAPVEDGPPEVKPGPQPWHSCHKLIYVRPNPKTGVPLGHWPIPEAFWPDQNSPTLVFVCNSAKYSDLGQPFGYLKASTTLTCVNLFVMPYNYPVLLPLLDDLLRVHKFKPTLKWRQSFENYLKTMPPYYIGALRKALRAIGAPNLLAENMEYGLSYSVTKLEAERVLASVGKKPAPEGGVKVRPRTSGVSLAQCRDFTQLLQGIMGDGPTVRPQSLRNAYDIPRRHLLEQLTRMRRNLLRASRCFLRGQDEDQLHSVPIAQMGNYQDFLKQCPQPLREADPDQPKRLHTFGNPFKLDKKGMMIDEADEFVSGPQNRSKRPGDPSLQNGGAPKRRRCMSPLLRPGRAYTPPVLNNHPPTITPNNNPNPPNGITLQPPLRAPETNHTLLDGVFGNHMGNHYNPERAPEPGGYLGAGGSPGGAQAERANHLDQGEEEEGEESWDQSSRGGLSEGSEDGDFGQGGLSLRPSAGQLKKLRDFEGQQQNAELRVLITKEIRKPGRRYERIFHFLKQVQGSLETRLLFLQNIIREAARFKRRVLIEQLENFLEELHMRANHLNHLD
ncbi:hypothetical protein JZ751_027643 [Albula glossodonta]|uniref:VWFA domain-containing protein n=1 Tax=Albula glossodonta TaxID=121402 RepID=A0A8T2PB52_9TELE|nr:hypothetical protein JZ751_027643 [Albula glossodonta]